MSWDQRRDFRDTATATADIGHYSRNECLWAVIHETHLKEVFPDCEVYKKGTGVDPSGAIIQGDLPTNDPDFYFQVVIRDEVVWESYIEYKSIPEGVDRTQMAIKTADLVKVSRLKGRIVVPTMRGWYCLKPEAMRYILAHIKDIPYAPFGGKWTCVTPRRVITKLMDDGLIRFTEWSPAAAKMAEDNREQLTANQARKSRIKMGIE